MSNWTDACATFGLLRTTSLDTPNPSFIPATAESLTNPVMGWAADAHEALCNLIADAINRDGVLCSRS